MAKDIILVTGGAGYIGSVLVKELVSRGEKVRVYDKLYFGDEALSDVKGKIDLVLGDVRQFNAGVLDGVKAVMHLGSLSNDPTAEFDPKANHGINFEGTMRVAEAAKKKGVNRFTFASSAAVIGFHVDEIADENYPTNPQSEYAQSKLDAENGLKALLSGSFCPVILRQATVFGFSPRMRYDLVVNTMTRDAYEKGEISVYSAGEMWRPLVDVRDIAKAHILVAGAPEEKVKGQIFNIVHMNYRILELAHWLKDVLKELKQLKVEVLFGKTETRSYRISGEKIKKDLGFTADRSVKDAAIEIFNILRSGKYNDFSNPIYYNIDWMKLLTSMEQRLKVIGKVF